MNNTRTRAHTDLRLRVGEGRRIDLGTLSITLLLELLTALLLPFSCLEALFLFPAFPEDLVFNLPGPSQDDK